MMRKVFLLFIIGSFSLLRVNAQNIYINSLSNLLKNASEPNVSLYICSPIDIEGRAIQLAVGSTIQFNGGKLYNGTLIGNNTEIFPDNSSCIGVVIKGTWISPKIDDSWFDEKYLDDNAIMSNINSLQSDEVENIVHLSRDYEVNIDEESLSAFILKSNTELNIHSTISIMANNYAKYAIIDITRRQNVTIEGGIIIGDVGKHNYISHSTSEWGMGINVVASQDVFISNLKVTRCTGDGIYLGGYRETSFSLFDNSCRNICISNVVCDNNRRQGLSIVHAKNVVIRNSEFINTGQEEFINPGHGIDIEPNISHNRNMSVSDVTVSNCIFIGNKGKDLSTAHYISSGIDGNIKNITIKKSQFEGEITIRSGFFVIDSIDVSRISVYLSLNNMGDIEVRNSTIRGGIYLHSSVADKGHPEYTGILNSLSFENCFFTNQNKNKGKYILTLSGDMTRIKNIEFIKCEFVEKGINIGNKELVNQSQRDACVFKNCISNIKQQ